MAHDCLEAGPDELTEEIIRNTAAACTEAANELIRNHPEVLTKLKHPDFFHLMVTSFQPSTGKSTIGTCRACVENGVLRTLEPKWIEFEPSSVFDTLFIGESKWVKEEVVPQPEFMEIACKCGVGSSSVADTTLETSEKVPPVGPSSNSRLGTETPCTPPTASAFLPRRNHRTGREDRRQQPLSTIIRNRTAD